MRRSVFCAVIALVPARGDADGIATVGGSPRAIGRAGAATVGDDGGGALLVNPAAIARRDTTRAELGASVIDDTVSWQSAAAAAPLSNGREGSRIAPLGAVIGAIGGWIVGAGVVTAAVFDRSLPRPGDDDRSEPDQDYDHRYDYRYAGIAGSYRRDTLVLGVARRVGDSLALGLSLGASRVRVSEHRRVWAGLGAADPVGTATDDVDLRFSATDPLSASAVAGALYAPLDSPIELGASLGWTSTVRLEGTVDAASLPSGPTVVTTGPARASLRVGQPLAVRAGGRYVGERVVAELDGDLWIAAAGSESASWRVHGIRVVAPTQTSVDLGAIPSRISQHTHVAVRTSIDVALVPGFLWATAGYAFSTRATPAARLSPSFGDLGGHTLGLGLETTAGGTTVTLGWSRTWSPATTTASELEVDNPFPGAGGSVPEGRYDGSIDQVGVLVETELGGRARFTGTR